MAAISDQLHEETLSTSYLYRGRIVNIRQDLVGLPGGTKAFREVVEHPGAVAVLALNREKDIIMVRQHRQPAAEILMEIPAGKLEPNEEPLDCAVRELREETGLQAEKWKQLSCFYPSPGFCDEKIFLFQAEDITSAGAPSTDPDEIVAAEWVPLDQAADMIADGRIRDGKTIIAVQAALIETIKT